jgi:hypothetical protein
MTVIQISLQVIYSALLPVDPSWAIIPFFQTLQVPLGTTQGFAHSLFLHSDPPPIHRGKRDPLFLLQ